ncbi:hypothetical protein [Chitinophaga filiformis]|uniref:Uncharacterized protein n=1 Tax=Chitinophaga filiformis TaxID=104663 RepID=A0A1G7I445_CHIFI|nr:hypothetical protein [Chitinophaga filiformis]SDF07501.1 hypothetical protein SAMN04488121_101714 [Chitinophaga filiformis]
MEKIGYIEIRITGTKGNDDLARDNYDIREVREVLEQAESLIVPGDKKERLPISYQLEEGSVRHIFKTSMQYVIGFNAIVGQVSNGQSVDFLDLPTAKAFEAFQHIAIRKHYTFEIRTSIENSNIVKIDQGTKFFRTEAIWAEAEFYFYGKVTSIGGKEKSSIHLVTDDFGILNIHTNRDYLTTLENNILYRTYGIRAIGKQHVETGELDRSTLQFVELIDYQAKYDEDYLNTLRAKAQSNWLKDINADDWLREIRGGHDA